jgi:hypothetical protein
MLLNFLGALASNFEVTADSRDTIQVLIVNFTCHRFILPVECDGVSRLACPPPTGNYRPAPEVTSSARPKAVAQDI